MLSHTISIIAYYYHVHMYMGIRICGISICSQLTRRFFAERKNMQGAGSRVEGGGAEDRPVQLRKRATTDAPPNFSPRVKRATQMSRL